MMEEFIEREEERTEKQHSQFEEKHSCENCLLSGTPHCRLLNMESCDKCFVDKLSEDDQKLVMEDICTVAAAMPYGGMEKLMYDDGCSRCADDEPNAADGGYVRFSIAHLHPTASEERPKGSKAYKRDTSIVVPVQLPVCKKCKKRIQLINFLPLCLGICIAAIVFAVVSTRSVFETLTKSGRIIPLLVALIGVLAGVVIANIVKVRLTNSAANKVFLEPGRIRSISELMNEGWFVVPSSELEMPYTFSKTPMKHGLLTCEDQEELIEEIIHWNDR